MAHCKYNRSSQCVDGVSSIPCDHLIEDWKELVSPQRRSCTSGFLSYSKSRSLGLSTASTTEPSSPRSVDITTFDCPPSPGLTRRLLDTAQARKRAGRHCLDGPGTLLRLTEPPAIDRWGIPDDLFLSLTTNANIAKKAGQHKLVRRRIGLCGEVKPVLVLDSKESAALLRHISATSSVYSPDPCLF